MTKKEVEQFITDYHDDATVKYFLSRVNLTAFESDVLNLRTKLGLTQEQAAERKDVAKNTIQRAEESLYRKLIQNWQGQDIINIYINYRLKG